jgi:hypothetical protein
MLIPIVNSTNLGPAAIIALNTIAPRATPGDEAGAVKHAVTPSDSGNSRSPSNIESERKFITHPLSY